MICDTLAMELRLSCTNPSRYKYIFDDVTDAFEIHRRNFEQTVYHFDAAYITKNKQEQRREFLAISPVLEVMILPNLGSVLDCPTV